MECLDSIAWLFTSAVPGARCVIRTITLFLIYKGLGCSKGMIMLDCFFFLVKSNKMLIGFSDELASVLPAIRATSVFTGVKPHS